jgi:hypothetical protein
MTNVTPFESSITNMNTNLAYKFKSHPHLELLIRAGQKYGNICGEEEFLMPLLFIQECFT